MPGAAEYAFDEEWRELIAVNARRKDWVGDHLVPLATAAFGTSLRRFFPYTSVNNLCFAEAPTNPFPGDQPGWIQVYEGVYVVKRPDLAHPDQGIVVLETGNPAEAVAAMAKILGQPRPKTK